MALRRDALWDATPSRLTVLTHRRYASLAIRGADMWMERLLPFLNGSYSFEQFAGSADSRHVDFLVKFLRTLVDLGVCSELYPEQAWAAESTDPLLNQLSYRVPDPVDVKLTWSMSRILVCGDIPLVHEIAAGCRRVGVSVGRASLDEARSIGLEESIAGTVCVVRRSTGSSVLSLERSLNILSMVILADGDRIWAVLPGTRLADVWDYLPGPRNEADVSIPGARHTVFSNYVANRLVQSLAGPSFEGGLVRFELSSMETHVHRAPASRESGASREESLSVRLASLKTLGEIPIARFSRDAVRYCDDEIGELGTVVEADVEQIPLRVARMPYRIPVAASHRTGTRWADAWGFARTAEDARHAAALEALRSRACFRSRDVDSPIECLDLLSDEPVWLAAKHVYVPAERVVTNGPPVGTAIGLSLRAAVSEALIDVLKERTLRDAMHAANEFRLIDTHSIPYGDESAFFLRVLLASRERVSIFNLSADAWCVPVIGVTLGSLCAGYGAGLDMEAALTGALREASRAWQSRRCRSPEMAPHPSWQIPPVQRVREFEWNGGNPGLTDQAMIGTLAAQGARPCLALLDTEGPISRLAPTVRVVLRPWECRMSDRSKQ